MHFEELFNWNPISKFVIKYMYENMNSNFVFIVSFLNYLPNKLFYFISFDYHFVIFFSITNVRNKNISPNKKNGIC